MKKTLMLAMLSVALTATSFTNKVSTSQLTTCETKDKAIPEAKWWTVLSPMAINCNIRFWYKDWLHEEPTGSTCDINTELTRLRTTFYFNTFSAYSSLGLHPHEFGYCAGYSDQIIYSDMEGCYH